MSEVMSNIKLNAWFEIDDGRYIWYLLQGYEIKIEDQWVLFTKDGKSHRTDGPAIIWTDGTQEWYLDGKLHRSDGPAIIWTDGTQVWYLNGKHHRTDGPAIIWKDGTQAWYLDGNLHRTDGPAYISSSGYQEWWLTDIEYTKQEFEKIINEQYQTQ